MWDLIFASRKQKDSGEYINCIEWGNLLYRPSDSLMGTDVMHAGIYVLPVPGRRTCPLEILNTCVHVHQSGSVCCHFLTACVLMFHRSHNRTAEDVYPVTF